MIKIIIKGPKQQRILGMAYWWTVSCSYIILEATVDLEYTLIVLKKKQKPKTKNTYHRDCKTFYNIWSKMLMSYTPLDWW